MPSEDVEIDSPPAVPEPPRPWLAANLSLIIDYSDVNASFSRRRITIKGLQTFRAQPYLNAWCHERQDNRTFRCDRIIAAYDAVTGEERPLPEILASMVKWESDPSGMLPGLPTAAAVDAAALMTVLMFIAGADGYAAWREKDAATAAVLCHLGPPADLQEALAATIRHRMDAMVPTTEAFAAAVVHCAATPSLARSCIDGAERVVKADGMRHEAETKWLAQLTGLLSIGSEDH